MRGRRWVSDVIDVSRLCWDVDARGDGTDDEEEEVGLLICSDGGLLLDACEGGGECVLECIACCTRVSVGRVCGGEIALG
jgi:hypothetical protein